MLSKEREGLRFFPFLVGGLTVYPFWLYKGHQRVNRYTFIRSVVAVEEAQANRADIFDYTGKSAVAEDYRAFIDEEYLLP